MSVAKVHRQYPVHEIRAARTEKKQRYQTVQVLSPESKSKQTCCQRLAAFIQKIWKGFCDLICCRIGKKAQPVKKAVEGSNQEKPKIVYQRNVRQPRHFSGPRHGHQPHGRKPAPDHLRVSVNDQQGGLPSTPINDRKMDAFPANVFRLITLPMDGAEVLSHGRVTIKGDQRIAQDPPYLSMIVGGDANLLLIDSDLENNNQPTNWGKGELAALGECSCLTLSRTKNPAYRREFDDTVLAHVVPQILSPHTKSYTITNFATGFLFASYVQAVQTIHKLKEENWKGKVIWNVIDTDYASSIRSNFQDNSEATKAILCFKEQIAKLLPPGIEFELNVFGSHADYIFAAKENGSLKYNFIMAMDLGHAGKTWTNRELSIAGKPEAVEFCLAKVPDPNNPEGVSKNIGKPRFTLRKVYQAALAYSPREGVRKASNER